MCPRITDDGYIVSNSTDEDGLPFVLQGPPEDPIDNPFLLDFQREEMLAQRDREEDEKEEEERQQQIREDAEEEEAYEAAWEAAGRPDDW